MSGFNGYIQLVYVLVAAMFVVGLHLMNSPATARRGNQVAMTGMVIAVIATFVLMIHAGTVTTTGWIVLIAGANVVGGYVVTGRMLKMFRRKAPQAEGQPGLESLNGHKGLKGLAGRIGIGRPRSEGAEP